MASWVGRGPKVLGSGARACKASVISRSSSSAGSSLFHQRWSLAGNKCSGSTREHPVQQKWHGGVKWWKDISVEMPGWTDTRCGSVKGDNATGARSCQKSLVLSFTLPVSSPGSSQCLCWDVQKPQDGLSPPAEYTQPFQQAWWKELRMPVQPQARFPGSCWWLPKSEWCFNAFLCSWIHFPELPIAHTNPFYVTKSQL